MIKNFAGNNLTFTLNDQTYSVPTDVEQVLPLSPQRYTYTASTPRGTVSGEFTITPGQVMELSLYIDGSGSMVSHQE